MAPESLHCLARLVNAATASWRVISSLEQSCTRKQNINFNCKTCLTIYTYSEFSNVMVLSCSCSSIEDRSNKYQQDICWSAVFFFCFFYYDITFMLELAFFSIWCHKHYNILFMHHVQNYHLLSTGIMKAQGDNGKKLIYVVSKWYFLFFPS